MCGPRLGHVLLRSLARDVAQAVVPVVPTEEGGGHGLALDERVEVRGRERPEVGVERSGLMVGHGVSLIGAGGLAISRRA